MTISDVVPSVAVPDGMTPDAAGIAGVLFLNKTYGRQDNRRDGPHLYKFKPNAKDAAVIYVPHTVHVGFNKNIYNLYVIVNGTQIDQVLGPTNDLAAYCKYQLYCNSLVLEHMPPLDQTQSEHIRRAVIDSAYEDRTTHRVFTIDGENTTDYDDALSMRGNILSVYISDVYHILEIGNLWNTLSGYVSNVYMPNDRLAMLCGAVVEICSLAAGKTSLALVMDYDISACTRSFSVVKVAPYRNFVYGTAELAADANYRAIAEFVRARAGSHLDSNSAADRDESQKVVEYLMRLMCFEVGAELFQRRCGIFRTINVPLEEYLPSNKYIQHAEVFQEPYAHITSPMRRLVDVLNLVALFSHENSTAAAAFYKQWVDKLDGLNFAAKAIRRVQNECALLHLYDDIKDVQHSGLVLSSETYERGGIYYYTVFLESIHLLGHFQSTELLRGRHLFRVFKFDKEANFRKKIRLGLA